MSLFSALVEIDILIMRRCFGGKDSETMSAAAWSLEQSGHFFGFWRPVIDLLFLPWESNHCATRWLLENPRN